MKKEQIPSVSKLVAGRIAPNCFFQSYIWGDYDRYDYVCIIILEIAISFFPYDSGFDYKATWVSPTP